MKAIKWTPTASQVTMGMNWLKQKADETGSTERLPFKDLAEEYMDVWQLRYAGNPVPFISQ